MTSIIKNLSHSIYHDEWRAASIRSEKTVNIIRFFLAFLGPGIMLVLGDSLPVRSQIIVGLLSGIYGTFYLTLILLFRSDAVTRSRWFNILQVISTIFDVAIITFALYALGEFRTFKSHMFQVYFLFIALSAFRYSRSLTIFTTVIITIAYLTIFTIAITTGAIELGSLEDEYTGPVISVIGVVIRFAFLILVAVVLTLTSTNQSKTIRKVIQLEREHKDEETNRALLLRYFSKNTAEYILNNEFNLQSERKKVTAMFCDFRNFTQFSDSHSTEAVVNILNRYLSPLVNIVHKYNGTLDKYTGDGFLAIFGAPINSPHDADNALQAALEIVEKVNILNQEGGGNITLNIGIGINSGEVVAGNIGTEQRLEYTVIGSTVNLASRLEGLNKRLSTSILVSSHTRESLEQMHEDIQFTYRGKVKVRGLKELVHVYAVTKHANSIPSVPTNQPL